MPSPIGHALAGIAAGWIVVSPEGRAPGLRRPAVGARDVRSIALFAAAGLAADLDLLVGAHSGPTHGLGAAMFAGAVALALAPAAGPRIRFALAVTAAYSTHILLDWLGTDTSTPIGIMALWPFSQAYYESSAHVFMAISRRYWLPEFWTSNLIAMGREFLILGPIVAMAMKVRRARVSDREVSR